MRYIIYNSHLLDMSGVTPADIAHYASELELAFAADGLDIPVDVRDNVSGIGSGLQGADDDRIADRVRAIADRVLEQTIG